MTLDDLKQALAAAQGSTTMDEVSKAELVRVYKEAVAAAEEAGRNDAAAQTFRNALSLAAEEKRQLEAELQALDRFQETGSDAWQALPQDIQSLDLTQLNQRLAEERIRQSELKRDATEVADRLNNEQNLRAEQIQEELKTARNTISNSQGALEALQSTTADGVAQEINKAKQISLRAQLQAARSKVVMLEQEQLSRGPRLARLTVRRDLAQAKSESGSRRLMAMEALVNQKRQAMADERQQYAEQIATEVEGDPVLEEILESYKAYSAENLDVTKQLGNVTNRRRVADEKLDVIEAKAKDVRDKLENGGVRGQFGRVLMDEERELPHRRANQENITLIRDEISGTRAKRFEVDEEIEDVTSLLAQQRYAQQITTETGKELLERRLEVLYQLRDSYIKLNEELDDLLNTEVLYLREVEDFRDYLSEKLFWVPSSEPISLETFTAIPSALVALFGPERMADVAGALVQILKQSLWRVILVGIIGVGLVIGRRRLKSRMEELNSHIRKTSQDKWTHTGQAFLITIALALPIPLLLGYVGWEMYRVAGTNSWLIGLAGVLFWSVPAVFTLAFMIQVCRPRGIGERHFGWKANLLKGVRRDMRMLAWIYVPAIMIVILTLFAGEPDHFTDHFDSLGRLVFIFAMVWVVYVSWHLFHPKKGVFSGYLEANPGGWMAQTSWAWYPLIVASPLILAGLAVAGYVLTAVSLNYRFQLSACIFAAAPIAYGLVLRAFSINERKLALQRILEQRRQKREGESTEAHEEGEFPEIDEDKIDLEVVGEQTRRLLRFLLGIALALGLWSAWADAVPILRHLDTVKVVGSLSWAGLLGGIVLFVVTIVASRNLPGILEIAILRKLPLDAGSRTAFATLIGYVVFAVGLALVFQTIQMPWSRFGWIAAALSVGLGFGLQEVVANFVCGIILLFERPIRVGDIVTVGTVTGSVTRIQIRATTITDWDRKEFVVPNKEFITGTLMNWTLSNRVNRIVIPVGISYSADPEKARQILLDVAREHPLITEDPKPLATFEGFGDSSLNLILRCYLPNLDERIETIHQLHTTIHRRFREEGIEIPFPQRDVHLRTVPEKLTIEDAGPPLGSSGAEPSA